MAGEVGLPKVGGQHLLRPELRQLGKRSSKSTSDRTLLESRQGHLLCPRPAAAAPSPNNPCSAQSPAHAHLSTESRSSSGRGPHLHLLAGTSLCAPRVSRPPSTSLAAALLPPGAGAGARAGLGGVGGSPHGSQGPAQGPPV